MAVRKPRSLLFALGFAVLFGASLWAQIPIWFLFLLLAIYSLYDAFRVERRWVPRGGDRPYGQLGLYEVDRDDTSFGLYLPLGGEAVFVDIREDEFLELRKARALQLYENRHALEENLRQFIAGSPAFQGRRVASIGLHSSDMGRAEVFWEPEGYSSLKGLSFSM